MLTNSDLKQILDALARYGKKDSQLDTVPIDLEHPEGTFTTNDYLSIVQDGKNKTIKIKNLEKVFLLTFLTDEDFREALKGRIPGEMLENASVTTEKLADGTITTIKISNNAVTTDKIADSNITTSKIQDGAITTAKIVNTSVTTEKIANSAITSSKIEDTAITTDKINDNAVTTSKISNGAVTTTKIPDNAITRDKINNFAITTDKIVDGAIINSKIDNGAVTNNKLADSTITTDKIEDGAITTEKIADGTITSEKIADGAIQSIDIKDGTLEGRKLANNSISGDKLVDGAITSTKIQDNSIPASKILDGTIQSVDIAEGTLTGSKFANGTIEGSSIADNTITGAKIANGGIQTANLTTGSITTEKLANGAVTAEKIGNSQITTTKINDGAVTSSKISDGSITSAKIDTGAVTTTKLADNSITTNKIDDGQVTTAKIADNAITSTKIPDNIITTAKLADNSVTSTKIVDNAITTAKIAANNVTTTKIADEAITEDKLADGAVTTSKLADGLISEIQNITDATPTEGSMKPVQSGGVKTAIDNVAFGALNLMNFVLLGHSSFYDLGFSTENTTIRSFTSYECCFANVSKDDYIKIRYQNYKNYKISVGFTQTLPKEGDSVENVITLDLSSDSAIETILRAPYDGFIVLHVRRESSMALYVQKNLEFLTTYSRYSIDAPVIKNKVVNSLETDENYGNLVSAPNTNWGYTDFVDVSNYEFLMTSNSSSTRHLSLLLLMPGAVFYDENKLPISTAYRVGYSATPYSDYSLITVPTQAKYIRCSSDNPEKVIYGFNTTIDKYLYPSDNVNYTDAEKELVRNSINASEFLYDEISFDNMTLRNYWINNSSKYGTSSSYKHYLLNILNVKGIRITANSALDAQYAWFTEMDTPTSGGTPPLLDGAVHYVTADTSEDIVVPAGAKFLYVYNGTSGTYLPSYLGFYTGTDDKDEFDSDFNERRDRQIADLTAIGLTNLNPPLDSDGWELPQTLQQLNALKKSEQLINIRWTPKWNVPSKYDPYYYLAGYTYNTGIPYSSNNDDGSKTIGEETSLHTFMTAINNPYSLIYTECINNQTKRQNPPQKSGWGKVYTGSSNGYAYYGTVCCGLTSSVENSPLKWNNPVIRNYNRTNGVYVPICPMGTVDFNLLKIGDVCDDTAHSFLIYGLHRNSNGEIDQVKIAESTSSCGRGGCRIRTITREQFISEISTGHNPPYTIFRYIKLWDNTDYEPSEYVPLTSRGEQETTVTYNDAICTFAGDKATFRETDLVVINYNLNGTQPYEWTKIVVYKDDVLLGEYTLSEAEQTLIDFYLNGGTPEDPHPITPDPFNAEINQHNHALVLGKTLASGKYKAQMSDDNGNITDFTYWEVLPNLVTVVANNPDNYTVTVGGTEEIQAVYINSMYYLPTFEEQQSRKFTVHPLSLAQKWAYTYATFGIKFKIKGIYGNITTLPTDLSGAFVPEEDPNEQD